jgi:hypothetical protein
MTASRKKQAGTSWTAFPADSWLGRALSDQPLSPDEAPPSNATKWPKYSETAYMTLDRTIQISWAAYEKDGSKMVGGTNYPPTAAKYSEILARHPGLEPGKTHTYEE